MICLFAAPENWKKHERNARVERGASTDARAANLLGAVNESKSPYFTWP
jgi:hypothetical protein